MSDYWDYLKSAIGGYAAGGYNGALQSLYDRAFDNSHGSDRYWLSQVPWFSKWRNMRDNARESQDRWDNSHTDEEYFNRVLGVSGASLNGDMSSFGNRAVRMARSLSQCYPIEVLEDVGIDSRIQNRGVA